MRAPLCIYCEPEELQQGLFGQTFYYILQILPYLQERGLYPQWELRTTHYGDPPQYLTVPGVLDLAYAPPVGPYRRVSLWEMRRRHAHVVGNDWDALHRLWSRYFHTPERIVRAAQASLPAGNILGIHYRGTDKQTALWDSNPITADEYLALAGDFLEQRPGFDAIFAASDQFSFVEQLRRTVSVPVISMGEVEFHMAAEHSTSRAEKADRAMLDCALLSQCACVLETSSALPSFAKLLNPSLEIYRCAASKLFGSLYSDMPYFPVAHVPVLSVQKPESKEILERTMQMDWTTQPESRPFLRPFIASPRWSFNHRVFRMAEQMGIDKPASYVFRGFF